MNDLQSIYDELSNTFCQLEAAAKEKIRTLEDKLANTLSTTKVRRDERQTDNATDISPQGPVLFFLYMYRNLGCTCT